MSTPLGAFRWRVLRRDEELLRQAIDNLLASVPASQLLRISDRFHRATPSSAPAPASGSPSSPRSPSPTTAPPDAALNEPQGVRVTLTLAHPASPAQPSSRTPPAPRQARTPDAGNQTAQRTGPLRHHNREASGSTHRSSSPGSVRHMSVTNATRCPHLADGDPR
ncbi:MAG TPA: hypothetical protein VGS19_01840 [Streptosporangiaceae bacterium]|nr:hypothetical protein [Streptosporangiaceae bacterium]